MALIELTNIEFTYWGAKTPALKDISLSAGVFAPQYVNSIFVNSINAILIYPLLIYENL